MKTNEDKWLKVLEDRVAELSEKHETHKAGIDKAIARFRKWAEIAEDVDIYYDAEYMARRVVDARETYKSVWRRLKEAEAELETYKETMDLD